MAPAPSLLIRSVLLALAGLSLAVAAPSVLVDDDFGSANDSLWHFQAAAFTEGVLSPGLEADVHGRAFATGQLRVDPSASSLRFVPRHGVKAHRSCFLGYRSDFRIMDVYAGKVEVDILGEVSNPAAADSLGGLYVLVRYEDEFGNASLARTTADIRFPQSIALDTSDLVPLRKTDWFSAPPLDAEKRARALSRIIGLGLCYISQSSSAFKSQFLQVGGIKARGELRWPRILGTPEEAEIMAGDTLALAWKFPAALDAEFQWYRNEKPVASARGRRHVFRPGADDARIHVFRADVRLPNGDRLATGQIKVKVLRPEPPDILRQSGDTAVPEGGNAILRIGATGLQPLAFQWFKNGKPIPGAMGTFFSFVPSSVSEGGQYHCVVADRSGRSAKSRPVALIVKPGPEKEGGLPQGLAVGPRVGLNVSDFYRDPRAPAPSEFNWNFIHAGLGVSWQIQPTWALQSELIFTRKGVVYDFGDHTSTYALDYLEWPLLARVRLGRWMPKSPLSLVAGGYGALLVNAAREEDWGAWKGTETLDALEVIDYGAVMGISWQFGVLSAEFRYTLGLAPLETGAGDPRMNGALSAMVGMNLFTAQEGPR